MNVVQGVPPPFLKEGVDDLTVKGRGAKGFQRLPQHCCFQRIVSPKGGITAADQDVIPPAVPGCRVNGPGDLTMGCLRLLGGKPTGVCQDKEHPLLLRKALTQGFRLPIRVYRYTVDSLHAGWVVIQDDHLFIALLKLPTQQGIRPLSVHRRKLRQYLHVQLLRRVHSPPSSSSSDRTTTPARRSKY